MHKTWLLTWALLSLALPKHALASNLTGESSVVLQQSKEKVVKGQVTDDSGPVIGATVKIKGTSVGAITDFDGNFSFKAQPGQTIEVSYIGYDTKTIVYKGESLLKIRIKESESQSLEEVQVIAYGAQKKVTVTGALTSIGSDEIMKSPVGNMANALSGKVPGLSSVQASGQPGSDGATLFVRGVGSLTTGLSSPLCLVDGVERSFTQIDPNEVEDITVLKDASATAVFGVRGANGVILVTTKRGTKGKAKISFSTSASVQLPTNIPEFANSYEYANAYNAAQLRDGVAEDKLMFSPEVIEKFRTGSNPVLYPSVSWTDLLIKNAALQSQHNISVSGGSDRVRYFASLGIFTQGGLFEIMHDNDKGFSFNRYNYRINMDVDVTKTTTMKINLGGYLSSQTQPNYNNGSYTDIAYLFSDIYTAVPFSGAGLVDGKWVVASKQVFGSFGSINDALNTYYGKGYNTKTGNTLNFDFQIEQKLNFITKGLKFHAKGAYNSGITYTKRREGRPERYEPFIGVNGETLLKKTQERSALGFTQSTGMSRNWYLEAAFNYKRTFGKHHISGLAMYNQSMKYYPSTYPGIPHAVVGLVGRATYDYATRYMFDFSIGYNGSENFAEGKRFGTFPAGSIGWIVSEEKFWKPLKKVVSYLKLRASYGIVGNENTSDGSRFLYLPNSYSISSGSTSFGELTNNRLPGAKEAKVGNPNVTWETSAKQNYGIDIQFFDSRLKVTFDRFVEHRKDILISRKVNPGYLAINLPIINLGKVDNKGYEVSVKWQDKIRNVRYHVGTSWAYAKNKIIFQDEIPQPYEWMRSTGRPVGQQFGYITDGFFSDDDAANYAQLKGQEGGIPDHGAGFTPKPGDVKYKDLNGDGKIDANDVSAIGYPSYPLLNGNLQAGFSWKGFDFSMTWAGAFQTSRMLSNVYRQPFGPMGNWSIMKYMIADAWTPEKGNASTAPAISLTGSSTNNYQNSDLWLRDASYVRLKNIEVGYSFPKNITSKLHVGSLRLSASAYNLLTFSKLDFVDPETNASGRTYPLIKIVNLGLKVGF